MKKVKSISKKVMSVGLAASLLLAPVGANNCCFAAREIAQQVNQGSSKVKDTLKKVELAGASIVIYAIIWLLLCNGAHDNYEGYSKIFNENKEAITNFWTVHGDEITLEGKWIVENIKNIGYGIYFFIMLLYENAYDIGESVYNVLDTIGFKNVLSAIGGLYVTNKLCNVTKWVCNKVAGWFKSEPKKPEKKDSKGKLEQTGNTDINNVNINNVNINNVDEDWINNNSDKLRKALGL